MSTKVLFGVSLGVNLVLAALLLRPSPVPDSEADSGTPSVVPPPVEAPAQTQPATAVITNTLVRKITWEAVESADYRQYIQNLRSIGCPDETIRDIILADVSKLYDSKRKQLRSGGRKFEYWKAGNPMAGMLGDPETLKQNRALEEEKLKVLHDLGIEPDPLNALLAAAGGNPMDAMFDFLPESKRIEVTKAMSEYQARMMDTASDGAMDGESMIQAQRAMENAIQKLLTPEEFQDYQLRFSMTANTLRQQIAGFDPSEEEFLAIFKIKEPFDQEFSPFGMSNPTEEDQRKRQEATTQLNERLRDTLGEERYADYQRAQDYSYQQLFQIAKKAELPATVANEVYGMKRAAESQAAEIRANQSLSAQQRLDALNAVRAETERSMQQSLGDPAWQQYNRPNNTWWLRNIAPSTPTPITVTPAP